MAPRAKRVKVDEGAKLPDLPYPFGPGPEVRVDVPEDVVIPTFLEMTGPARESLRQATREWQWDAFAYVLHVPTYPLATLMKHMLFYSSLGDEFIPKHREKQLDRFLVAVDLHYHRPIRNPAEDRVNIKSTAGGGEGLRVGYHNVVHACDVLQSTYAYIHFSDLTTHQPCPRFRYEMLFAAMVHDLGHVGVDNNFLVKTKSQAAETCPEAPLEYYHSRFGEIIDCQFDGFDFTTLIGDGDRLNHRYFKWDAFVPMMVMDTDMSRHADILRRAGADGASKWLPPREDAQWSNLVEEAKEWSTYCEKKRIENKRLLKFAGGVDVEGYRETSHDGLLDRVRTLQTLVLKAADLGHLARPLRVHKEWVEVLFEEFWALGDREAAAGLDVNPLHDRLNASGVKLAESQMGFFTKVGLPLFEALVEVLPSARCQLDAVRTNLEYWETRLAEETVKEAKAGGGC